MELPAPTQPTAPTSELEEGEIEAQGGGDGEDDDAEAEIPLEGAGCMKWYLLDG